MDPWHQPKMVSALEYAKASDFDVQPWQKSALAALVDPAVTTVQFFNSSGTVLTNFMGMVPPETPVTIRLLTDAEAAEEEFPLFKDPSLAEIGEVVIYRSDNEDPRAAFLSFYVPPGPSFTFRLGRVLTFEREILTLRSGTQVRAWRRVE